MFQMANLGPMMGQAATFIRYFDEKVTAAIDRYQNESNRIFGVLDEHLSRNEYLAGAYSIADMATYPWLFFAEWCGVPYDGYQNLNKYVANKAKTTLNTNAPATPQSIICLLFFGTKLEAINPIIIALSAAKIISIKIIWVNITISSIKVIYI